MSENKTRVFARKEKPMIQKKSGSTEQYNLNNILLNFSNLRHSLEKLNRAILLLLFLVLLVCGFSKPLLAATYYVSKMGNDSYNGTETQPWLTIQKAAQTVTAGDTVYVQPGTYNERVTCSTASGTEASPIRFIASGTVTNYGWYFSRPYYIIEGFTIVGDTSIPQYYQGLITITKDASGTQIKNNTIAANPNLDLINRYGILMYPTVYGVSPANCVISGNKIIEPQFHAITAFGKGHLVENNYFTGTKGWDAIRAMSDNTTYRGNFFENWSNLSSNLNHPDLFQAFSNNGETARSVVVENNYAVNCTGVQIGNITDDGEANRIAWWTWRNNIFVNVGYAMSMFAPEMHFYNNVFYRCGINTAGPILFRTSADTRGEGNNGKVFNNIFMECGSNPAATNNGWYYVDAGLSGFSADHNLVIGTGAGTIKTGFNEAHGLNGKDPLFVDLPNLNFRLGAGSPAIGTGINLYDLFTADMSGALRQSASAWDIGAFNALNVTGLKVVSP
jgi:hypothetical protein